MLRTATVEDVSPMVETQEVIIRKFAELFALKQTEHELAGLQDSCLGSGKPKQRQKVRKVNYRH